MKVVFSPTKDMNLDKKFNKDWNISEDTKKILSIMLNFSDDQLKNNLKINDNILEDVKSYISNFNKVESYRAIDLYNGLSFRTMKTTEFSEQSLSFLSENMLILSAFYGPISPLTLIKPYRLDFLSNIKIDNTSLVNFWKKRFNNFIEDGETVLNLASNEFSNILDKSKYNWIDFEFYELKDRKLKKHSTISKKGRGLMVKYLADNRIVDLDDLKKFNYDGYSLSNDSSYNNFIFVKKV